MLYLGIAFIGLAAFVGFVGAFAAGMSDVPGATSGVGGFAVLLFGIGAICIAMWFGGYHLNLITRN